MNRVAVFVDAGYLFAAGSEAIAGAKRPRRQIRLDHDAVMSEIKSFAQTVTGCQLLRVYWYDGTSAGPTAEQLAVAYCTDAKLRLGFINTRGEQKGVDSLIVTDMITLARNRAISDAVLLSGDEDIRVGVQQAQEHGVRVHLLGIACGQENQSGFLRQEADCTHLWRADDVLKFLSIVVDTPAAKPAPELPATAPLKTTAKARKPGDESESALDSEPAIKAAAMAVIATLSPGELTAIVQLASPHSVPRDVDRKLLTTARNELGRLLTKPEARKLRGVFIDACKAAQPKSETDTPM